MIETGLETESIILKIYVINFPIYTWHQIPAEFKYTSSLRWCSLKKIFLKTSQYS